MAEKYIIILPLNHSLIRTSDYYKQTSAILRKRGSIIFAYHHYRIPVSIWRLLSTKYREPLAAESNDKQFISCTPFHVVPFDRFHFIHQLNQTISYILFLIYIRFKSQNNVRVILWIVNPLFYWMLPLSKAIFGNRLLCLYDCLEYMTSENIDIERNFRHGDSYLLRHAALVTTNNDVLFDMHRQIRIDVQKVPAGFRLNDFRLAAKTRATIKRKIVGYVGTINYRLDFPLLDKVCRDNPDLLFQFIGPLYGDEERQSESQRAFKKLCSRPNVEWLDYMDPKKLYGIISTWKAGLIPYQLSDLLNQYCEPLKLMEYFYAGIPVIATPIPSLKKYGALVNVGGDSIVWNMLLDHFKNRGLSKVEKERMMQVAVANSWEAKVDMILTLLGNR